jgi:DNA transposition AAA+ family ATPase
MKSHDDSSPEETGRGPDAINIPDHALHSGIEEYSQAEQDAILWMFAYARSDLDNSRERLCTALGCDWTTVMRIASGKYSASLDGFIKLIADLRAREQTTVNSSFVETVVTRKIHETLDYAVAGDNEGGHMVMICGGARRGKSRSVLQWCRQDSNRARAVYIDCPESGGLHEFKVEIAKAIGVSRKKYGHDLRSRIFRSFSRRRILIVDEIFRAVPSPRSQCRPLILEFIRRLHDVTHCAVALVATPVFKHELEAGPMQDYMEQLLGRISDPLVIPRSVLRSEVAEICKGFAPDPSPELVTIATEIANVPGKLKVLFELLGHAAKLARKKGAPVDHAMLKAAWERRKNRVKWPEEKE